MIVTTSDTEHLVHEYDFTLDSGQILSVLVDPTYDTITIGDIYVDIVLGAKKVSGRDFEQEEICLTRSRVAMFTHRPKKVVDKTPEEQDEWDRLIDELSGGSNSIN